MVKLNLNIYLCLKGKMEKLYLQNQLTLNFKK